MKVWDTLWTLIDYELPTDTKEAQLAAKRFRRALIKMGPPALGNLALKRGTALYPVRFSKAKALFDLIPPDGKLALVGVTDKQWEKGITKWGKLRHPAVAT